MDCFVTDTHPLVHYAADALSKLGPNARAAFEGFEAGKVALYVPAPVVLETWLLARGGKLKLRTSLGSWWRQLESAGLVHVPLEAADIVSATELEWSHGDIFDRTIVAIAMRIGLPLITADGAITDWGRIDVHW